MISYYKYYVEMKNRVFLLFISWSFVSIICYLYKETLLFLLINSNRCQEQYFIFTDISEVFYVYLNLTFFISNQVLIMMFIYHCLLFLFSGLYKSEYNKLQFAFKISVFSWISSIFLLNEVLIPVSWNFFLSFQQTDNITFFFEAKIVEYFNYFTNLYRICFLNCQLLAIITLILRSFSDDLTKVRKFRKLFYLIFVMFATLTTPPDIISQVSMSISLVTLYELLLFLSILRTSKVTS